jgi:hypothetical protein
VIGILVAALTAGASAQQQPQQPAGRGSSIGPGQVATGPGRGRPTPPQPQQNPGPDYLAGTWEFSWTGRESPLTIGPRSGTVTFTRQGDQAVLATRAVGTVDDSGAPFEETGTVEWNETQKTLTFKERVGPGVDLSGVGDWSSPLAIRYESQPARASGRSVRVRRTYSILSATSFAVAEEISIDGGPYVRLGNGSYKKSEASSAK